MDDKKTNESEVVMKHLDANTLVAYVDGELDMESAALVEQQLADDAEARETARVLRECAAMVHAAHSHVIHETVPDRLVDCILEAPEQATAAAGESDLVEMIMNAPEGPVPANQADAGAGAIPLSRRRSVAAMAMAATFAAVLIGGGFYAGKTQPNGVSASMQQTRAVSAMDDPRREAALQEALETKRSLKEFASWSSPETGRSGKVTPVRTYRREDGTFCREYKFEESHPLPDRPNYGIACRTESGSWVKQLQVITGS